MSREQVESLLIVKMSSIGDVVHSLPVLAALRREFPQAHIAWAVGSAAAEVVVGSPYLSEVLVLGGQGTSAPGVQFLPSLSSPRRLARALRQRRFDVALDMQGLLKSALVACLSGARERIGFRNFQEGAFLLNNRSVVPDRRDVHAVEAYLGFAEAMGATPGPLDFTIATTEADRQRAEELLDGQENIIGLIPGARWESKRWPAERFAEVAERLASDSGSTAVVLGAAGDGGLAAEIGAAPGVPVLDLTGRTSLKQLAEVFRRCRAVISNDTGPMYIASAVGAPTVAIFGPTDPRRLGPYGEGHAKVAASVACSPCRRRSCRPLRCMDSISVGQVMEAARGIMREPVTGGDGWQRPTRSPA